MWTAEAIVDPTTVDPALGGAPTIFFFSLDRIGHPFDSGHSGFIAYGNGTQWHDYASMLASRTTSSAVTSILPSFYSSSSTWPSIPVTHGSATLNGTATSPTNTGQQVAGTPASSFPATNQSTSHNPASNISTIVEAVLGSILGTVLLFLLWAGLRKDRRGIRAIPAACRQSYRSVSRVTASKKSQASHAPGQGMWTPEILQKRWLFSMAAFFCMIIVTLGILGIVSNRNNGLCNVETRLHYLWTYTPTALFTILAAIWSQVLYRTKQIQPWVSMAEDRKEASENVLLDYISDLDLLVIFKALKRGHVVVAAAVLVSLLLQLLIVLSTGLLTSQTFNNYPSETNLQLIDRFLANGSAFSPARVDIRPAALVLGLAQEDLTLPPGITRDMAYQQFAGPEDFNEGTLSTQATVDVISSHMECEVAKLLTDYGHMPKATATVLTDVNGATKSLRIFGTSHTAPSATPVSYVYGITSPSCVNASIPTLWPDTSTTARMLQVNCSNPDATAPSRGLVVLVDTLNESQGALDNSGAAIICRPFYGLRKLPVTISREPQAQISDLNTSYTSTVPGFDAWKLVEALQSSVNNGYTIFENAGKYFGAIGPDIDINWLWLALSSPQRSLNEYQDVNVMEATFKQAWATFTAQFFNLYFREPSTGTVSGTSTADQERLVLRSLSLWMTEGCLLLVCALCCFIGGFGITAVVPRDPSSIAGFATILSTGPGLQAALRDTGAASRAQLAGLLTTNAFSTRTTQLRGGFVPGFCIESEMRAVGTDYTQNWRDTLKRKKVEWIQPISTWYLYKVGMPALMLSMMVTLEVLLHQSQMRQGLTVVAGPGSYEHYYWSLLPALVMTALSWLVTIQYDTVKLFSPYSILSTGPENATATVLRRPNSGFALWYNIRRLEFAFMASGLAALASLFLTIVVSGMFSSVPALTTTPVSLTQVDWFGPPSASITQKSALQVDMVLNGNLTFPKFTNGSLALSRIEGAGLQINGTLNAAVPGIRGKMNCTLIPSDQNSIVTVGAPEPLSLLQGGAFLPASVAHDVYINLTKVGYGPCIYTGADTNIGILASGDTVEVFAPSDGYFGGLLWGVGEPQSCPWVIAAFGRTSPATATGEIEITTFTCMPYAEIVIANVTFLLPGMEIDPSTLITVDERRTTPFQHDIRKYDVNPLRGLQTNATNVATSGSHILDGFMQTLLYGSGGIPADELVGTKNANRLISASSDLFGIALAQVMDLSRIPPDTSASTPVSGTITSQSSHRLVQSPIATHILVGLIGFILLTSTFTSYGMKTRKVLPKEPSNIAALASLLVDSDFLTLFQPQDQWLSDKQLLARLEKYSFSLGWWPGAEGDVGKRRFGIDYGRAEGLK